MNDQTPIDTALVLPQGVELEALFKVKNGLDPAIDELEKRALADAETADVTTAKGRKHLISVAYNVSRSKTAMEKHAKALTEKQRAEITTINEARNAGSTRLDGLRDKIRKPVTDWDKAEEKRLEALKLAMEVLDLGRVDAHLQSDIIRSVIEEIEAVSVGEEWEEYQPLAIKGKADCLAKFSADLKSAEQREKREADQAHRARILNDISQALLPIPREELARALMDGRIPHVSVAL